MSNKTGKQDPLRAAAEAQFSFALKLEPHSANELQNELEVHQIELVMQNEQLRQTQVALEESRDRYANLYEFAPVGYFTLNHEGMIDEINLTGATLFGVERSKLLHRRFAHFIAHKDLDCWRRHFLNVLTRDNTVTCVVALQHGNRPRFYARLDCLRVSEAGKIPVVRVALTDITEHKQAESMLRASEEKFRAIFEGTLDGVLLADAESRRFVTGNPAICRMLGYSHEELTRLSVSDIHPPQDLQHVIEQFEGQLRGEIQLSAYLPIKRRDGSVFYADIKSSSVNFGDKTYLLGVFRDTTERKLAEETLHKANDELSLFRTLLDKSSDAIEVINPITLRFLDVNETACRDLGYSREELLSMSVYDVDPSISQATRTMLDEQIQKSGTARYESIHRRKDGSTFPVEVSIVSVNFDRPYGLSIARDITERKKLELDREQYLKFFMLSINPMCIADPHGCFKQVNPAFVQLTGYSESELIAKPFLEFVLPEDRQRTDDEMKLQVANRPTLQFDNRYLCKNGTVINLSWTAYYDKHDGTSYATAIDITERKQMEETLKNMAAKFHTVFDSSADAIMLFDGNGFIDCNEATLWLFGCHTCADFISKHPAELSPPTQPGGKDSMRLADEHIATAFKNGSNLFEWIHRRLDGTEFLAEVLLTALELDGKPVLQATVRDITERKHAEDALQKSEEQYRRIVETAQEGIWIIDANNKTTFANNKIAELLGYTVEEMHGMSLFDFMDEEGKAISVLNVERRRQGISEQHDFKLQRKDGTDLWAIMETNPMVNEGGDYVGALAMITDITARVRSQSQLLEQLDELRRWHEVTSGREARILDLKHEVNDLLSQTGKYPRYPSAEYQDKTEK